MRKHILLPTLAAAALTFAGAASLSTPAAAAVFAAPAVLNGPALSGPAATELTPVHWRRGYYGGYYARPHYRPYYAPRYYRHW